MEMGVNRGQPPGSVQAQGYQTLSNQDYMPSYGEDGSYYPGQCPQQGTMYHLSQPAKMSPNQGLAYRKHGIVGYQSNADQVQYMAKKGVFMGECVQPMGVYSVRQPAQHSTVMYPPNGVSATQTLHVNPGLGTQQGGYMARSMMPGHSPNQGQFQGPMVYQGQGQIQQRMMWYQEPGLSTPPSGMPVRFSGNQQLPMMSPPPQQPMMMSPPPQQQQQQPQMHHLMMSPGQSPAPPPPQQGGVSPMWVMSQQPRMQHYSQEQVLSGGVTCPSSPGYQPHTQHFHQYRPQHVKAQHVFGTHITAPNYSSPPQQSSPSIPYSQALEGYPSPSHTPTRSGQPGHGGSEYHSTLQTGLPASSRAQGTCVYTIANTQMLQGTTVSTSSQMSGDHGTSSATHSVMSSDQKPGLATSVSGEHQLNSKNAERIRNCTNADGSLTDTTSQSVNWDRLTGCGQCLSSSLSSSSVHNTFESKSVTVDNKVGSTGVTDDEASDRICMQRSYSCTKLDHSSVSSSGQSSAHHTVTAPGSNKSSSPAAASSAEGDSSESGDVAMVVVPFGWKRVIEDGAVVYYSPSKTRLDSTTAITEYLMKEGTCKCGLSCPLLVDKTFNFDSEVISTEWSADSIKHSDNLNNLCNHKRKMIAMATLQTTSNLQTASQFTDGQQAASKVLEALSLNKKDGTKKKKTKVKGGSGVNPYDGMLVSQLLMHRDKLREHGMNAMQPRLSYLDRSGGQSGQNVDENLKLNTPNSGMNPKCGNEPQREDLSVIGQISNSEMVQMSTDCHGLQRMHYGEMVGAEGKYAFGVQGAGAANQFANGPHGLYRIGMHQKGSEEQLPATGSHNQMTYGQQKGCMPAANQMFSLQLQMQAQAAAARNAGLSHRCGVMSPSLSSYPQHSSPSPSRHGLHGKLGDVVNSPPPYVTNSSPSSSVGLHHTSRDSCSSTHPITHVYTPATPQADDAPVKKKKKKKRKRDAFNKTMSGLLDRNMPCPNVDVRQFSETASSGHVLMSSGLSGYGAHTQGEKMASFMDNPTAFLAQQAEMVTNKMKSTENVLFPDSETKVDAVSKDDSLEHLLQVNGGASAESSNKSAIDEGSQCSDDARHGSPGSPRRKENKQPENLPLHNHHESGENSSSHSVNTAFQPDSSRPDGIAAGTAAVVNHNPKEFPASCLLTAAARAKLAQPTTIGDGPALTKTPNSWRFRVPSGPAPIRHVPPGGQQIGGGSIVYHHKIENQQAFHEGGIVNGGGILMMTSPAHRGDSLMVNCIPSVPLMLQDAMASKGIHLLGDLVQNMATGVECRSVVDVSDATVIYNLLQCSMNEQLQAKLGAVSSKEQDGGTVSVVQNSICSTGKDKSSDPLLPAEATSDENRLNKDGVQVKGLPDGQINGLTLAQVSRKVAMTTLNLPMPPLPDSAVTAVTNSITQVIPASGVQSLGCVQSSETHITSNMVHLNMVVEASSEITAEVNAGDSTGKPPQLSSSADGMKRVCSDHEQPDSAGQVSLGQLKSNTNKVSRPPGKKVLTPKSGSRPTVGLRTKIWIGRRKKRRKRRRFAKMDKPELEEDITKPKLASPENQDASQGEAEREMLPKDGMTTELDGSQDMGQDAEQPIADDGALMMTAYQNEGFPMSQSDILDSSQIVLGHGHDVQQQYLPAQGQEVGPVCFSSPGQHPGSMGATQGQAANIIQTVSFLPNMVGIDPNTGLVQSIHMPLAPGANSAKDQPVMSVEQLSPLPQSHVVQTVVQSLHIQNNVLVQGMTPGGVPGAFLQPLSAVGNTLIPVFQSPVAVGANCDEGTLSVMSVTPVSNSTDVHPTYAESPKKSCHVVSTQTEAVQTEDSCSDLMDTEGGGRLLVEYEDSILADDSYVLESGEMESSVMVYADHSVEESSEPTSVEANVAVSSPDEPKSVESSISVSETRSSTANLCRHTPDDPTCTASVQTAPSVSSGNVEHQALVLEADCQTANDSENSGQTSHPSIYSKSLPPRTLVGQSNNQHITESASSDGTDEVLSGIHSDSSSSVPVPHTIGLDGAIQTDSESATMPVLSRESSVVSDSMRVSDQDESRVNSALEQIHTRLEDAVRRYLEQHKDCTDLSVGLYQPTVQKDQKPVSNIQKGDPKQSTEPQKEDSFGEPPNLPAMTRLGRATRKRAFFQKNRCSRYKKKVRKVVRNGLCGLLAGQRAGLQQPRNATCKDSVANTQFDNEEKEPVPLNNNKPTSILLEAPSDVILPEPVTEAKPDSAESVPVKASVGEVPSKQTKMSTSSASGSSDGEANQSSDSSQTMSTSEGDDVRCGNSPAIRCSNLLTSSPETGEINCSGLGDFEKLETIYTDGSATNHITATSRQIKTRRSLRAELDNMLPNHGMKQSFCDRKSEVDHGDDSSGTASPDPSYTRTLCPGELIWGPVKTYPSWPGKLVSYNDVPKNPKSEDGKLWVHWFGFHTYSQVEPQELKTLTEGLEAHHSARQKHRKGRKLNSSLEAAIQEAMLELDRQMEQDNQSAVGTDIAVETKVNKAGGKKKKLR